MHIFFTSFFFAYFSTGATFELTQRKYLNFSLDKKQTKKYKAIRTDFAVSNSALQRQRTALDSQCFWPLPHSSQSHLHLPPPPVSCASVKSPLFQRVPQQRAIIDGICYISPNGQPKQGPVCLLQKHKPAFFCPKTCNLNSQTGQR